MFISDEEANRRLESSTELLSVLNPKPVPPQPTPVIIPEVVPDDEECASASGIVEGPDEKLLRKILGIGYGRKPGQIEMPKELQAAVAVTAQIVNSGTAAQVFGTSYHHADELKHGFTNQIARYGDEDSSPELPNKELERIVDRQKKEVRDLAFEKLTKALGLMSDDKLEALTDVVKLSRVARDLSVVVEKTLPKDNTQIGGLHFHVWKPEMREEQSYETVSVGGSR